MSEIRGVLQAPNDQELAFHKLEGRGPTLVWHCGAGADMQGSKAQALADWAARSGRAMVRFDYSGHGASSGRMERGTIGAWREEALCVLDELVEGPAILVGSSMGGWLACLVALARPERSKALVLLAPAVDFTSKLIWARLPSTARQAIRSEGIWWRPGEGGGRGLPVTRTLLEEGRRWSILPGPIAIRAPVRILQGGADQDVPAHHAAAVARALQSQDVVFTLIKDAGHRLSRPQDLARMIAAADEVSA